MRSVVAELRKVEAPTSPGEILRGHEPLHLVLDERTVVVLQVAAEVAGVQALVGVVVGVDEPGAVMPAHGGVEPEGRQVETYRSQPGRRCHGRCRS